MRTRYARDVMNPEVLGLRQNMTVREAAGFLTENQITGAPVLDDQGRLVGVVSLTDLAESEVERPDLVPDRARPALDVRGWEERVDARDLTPQHLEAEDLLVRDIMTPTVYTVPEDTPVPEIARTMIAGRIHRLFVTRKRKVVGIVTPLDLLRLLAEEGPSGGAVGVQAGSRRRLRVSGPRKREAAAGGRRAPPRRRA